MPKKTVNELEEEVQKLIKVNNSNFVEQQRSEHELRDIIRKKDKEINVCRTVLENKDKKISILQDKNSFLENQVETLKFEEETDKAIVERLYAKLDDKVKQVDVHNEEKDKLTEEYEKNIKDMSKKVENLQSRIEYLNRNSSLKANLLKKLEELSNVRMKELDKLKVSVQQCKKVEKCRFGTKCRRWLCKYSHAHFFVKDNRVEKREEQKNEFNIKCNQCDEMFHEKTDLKEHILFTHQEETVIRSRVFVTSTVICEAPDNIEENGEVCEDSQHETETDTDASSIELTDSETDDEEGNSETESGEDY